MKSLRPPQGKWARPREERGREGRGEDVGGSWGLCPPLALPLTSLLSEPHQAPLPPWAFADPHTHRSPPSGPCALRAADGQCISAAGGRRWRGRARARRSQRPRPLGTKGCLPLPTLPTGSGPGPHVQAHTAPAEHLDGPTHPGAADLLPVQRGALRPAPGLLQGTGPPHGAGRQAWQCSGSADDAVWHACRFPYLFVPKLRSPCWCQGSTTRWRPLWKVSATRASLTSSR